MRVSLPLLKNFIFSSLLRILLRSMERLFIIPSVNPSRGPLSTRSPSGSVEERRENFLLLKDVYKRQLWKRSRRLWAESKKQLYSAQIQSLQKFCRDLNKHAAPHESTHYAKKRIAGAFFSLFVRNLPAAHAVTLQFSSYFAKSMNKRLTSRHFSAIINTADN